MALKILKVIWVFSLLGVMASFMYVYAGLPENVVVNENPETITVTKETVFYIALAILVGAVIDLGVLGGKAVEEVAA